MKSTAAIFIFVILTMGSMLAADAKNGEVAYGKSCKSCHGVDGTPNAAVAKMLNAQIPVLGSTDVQAKSDDEIKKVVTEGQGKMKPVKAVTGDTLDDVVAYVRSLKK